MSVSREELRQECEDAINVVINRTPAFDTPSAALITNAFLAVPGVAAALRLKDAVENAVRIDGWGTMEFPGTFARMDDAETTIAHLRSVLSEPT